MADDARPLIDRLITRHDAPMNRTRVRFAGYSVTDYPNDWNTIDVSVGEAVLNAMRQEADSAAEHLAVAILSGDVEAALIAADEVQERHARPEGFISRDDLLDLLRSLECSSPDGDCPCCWSYAHTDHRHDCKLALAIGAKREEA